MKDKPRDAVFSNLSFLIAEVTTQLSQLQNTIAQNSRPLPRMPNRSGYVSNLKTRIQNACYDYSATLENQSQKYLLPRAIDTVTVQLERIADCCAECLAYRNGLAELVTNKHNHLLTLVIANVKEIERCCCENDSDLAIAVAGEAQKIQKTCLRIHEELVGQINADKDNNARIVSKMFAVHLVKSMSECLLKISEAILSSATGQVLTINRYQNLSAILHKKASDKKRPIENLADTRSGNAISGVMNKRREDIIAVFKNGQKRQLKEEKKSVENWHTILPGIAPRVLDYRKQGSDAALLIEHLSGDTLEEIVLHGSDVLVTQALNELKKTLRTIWSKTHTQQPVNAQYMRQLLKRLDAVYSLHPNFEQLSSRIAGISQPSFQQLITRADRLEKSIPAPFSVYIHGDFNTDNILFDAELSKISFIDLHRSCQMDYVQDISVFMVSNFRLQSLDQPFRKRVQQINLELYRFAQQFAQRQQDRTFNVRLGLSLARSFATSTRFVLDKTLSKAMFLRARYLLEQVGSLSTQQYRSYRPPIRELFIG